MAADGSKTRVIILTGNYRIDGNIHLLPGARMTDYMIQAKGFIAVTEAEVSDVAGAKVYTAPFIDVNLNHIQIITPGATLS